VGSETQTAQYRQIMIDNYIPIAELGGAWGWGNIFPIIEGQTSIDNEFLFVWITQGYIGLIILILIFIEATITLVRLGIRARLFQDRYLAFSLLGIVLGLALCLGTVWLTEVPYLLFFVLMGWFESIQPAAIANAKTRPERVRESISQAVAVRVYT
jgi:hypothetical protein